jgi:hypothetical protein
MENPGICGIMESERKNNFMPDFCHVWQKIKKENRR